MNSLNGSAPLPTLSALVPGPTDRAVLVGTTGSGKTTLAQVLLSFRKFAVVHDGKGTINWPGYKLVRRLRDLTLLAARSHPRLVYRPTVEEMRSEETQDRFFRWVYHRRNCTLYVDETYAVVSPGGLVLPAYQACITRGRERGVEVWSGTQRPSNIPLIVLSESEHYYVFRLQIREDRKRLEGVTGLDEELVAVLPKRQFYYVAQGEGPRGPLTLNLAKEGSTR